MEIKYTDTARKQLKGLGSQAAQRIVTKLKKYARNQKSFANQVKPMKGVDALRLRIGDYRVIFNQEGTILRVLKVGHRKDIYR